MNDPILAAGARSNSASHAARRDLIIVVLAVLVALLLFVSLEMNEALFALTRRWELLQLDEIPATLLVLAIGLAWFSWRRYRETRAELVRRCAAEGRFRELLVENRRLAQQCLESQESERKRLARELHDELGQYLNAIKADAALLRQLIDAPPAMRAVTAIGRHAEHLYSVVRTLIRGLRPVALDELGLSAAIEHYVEECAQCMPQMKFEVSLEGELDTLREPVGLAVYRVVQESVTNISRHARASHVVLRVARAAADEGAGEAVTVIVQDDGRGADLRRTASGMGLIGMRERVETLGGRWRVRTRPNEGFGIFAWIPLQASASAAAA